MNRHTRDLSGVQFGLICLILTCILGVLLWNVWSAFRYGSYSNGRRTISRNDSPMRFWFGVVGTVFLALFLSASLAVLVIDWVWGLSG